MNVVDSSGWLAYIAQEHNAEKFAHAIEDVLHLIVPTIVVYEVSKKLLQQVGRDGMLEAVARMKMGIVSDLDMDIALDASRLCFKHSLPMADGIILATAQLHDATLWTQDSDFRSFENVKYFAKR